MATLVIIESPYAGRGTDAYNDLQENIEYAKQAMMDCLRRGEYPYASHLLFTQEGLLDDNNPEQRHLGIEAGLAWGAKADKTVVYIDRWISEGMQKGIDRAKAAGRPIEYRSLTFPGWKPKLPEKPIHPAQ